MAEIDGDVQKADGVFTEEALKANDGKKVPLTADFGGPVIGEATMFYDAGEKVLKARFQIDDPKMVAFLQTPFTDILAYEREPLTDVNVIRLNGVKVVTPVSAGSYRMFEISQNEHGIKTVRIGANMRQLIPQVNLLVGHTVDLVIHPQEWGRGIQNYLIHIEKES